MRYVFTGPSKLGPKQARQVEQTIRSLKNVEEFTTGAAFGVDTLAYYMGVKLHPHAKHRVCVPVGHAHNDTLVQHARGFGATIVPVHGGYRNRNEAMFDPLDPPDQTLVAFVKSLGFYRSGEWMTINIAKKLRVCVYGNELEEEK
jgi:hypothetical protein